MPQSMSKKMNSVTTFRAAEGGGENFQRIRDATSSVSPENHQGIVLLGRKIQTTHVLFVVRARSWQKPVLEQWEKLITFVRLVKIRKWDQRGKSRSAGLLGAAKVAE